MLLLPVLGQLVTTVGRWRLLHPRGDGGIAVQLVEFAPQLNGVAIHNRLAAFRHPEARSVVIRVRFRSLCRKSYSLVFNDDDVITLSGVYARNR